MQYTSLRKELCRELNMEANYNQQFCTLVCRKPGQRLLHRRHLAIYLKRLCCAQALDVKAPLRNIPFLFTAIAHMAALPVCQGNGGWLCKRGEEPQTPVTSIF